jgi:hypothetical protein
VARSCERAAAGPGRRRGANEQEALKENHDLRRLMACGLPHIGAAEARFFCGPSEACALETPRLHSRAHKPRVPRSIEKVVTGAFLRRHTRYGSCGHRFGRH